MLFIYIYKASILILEFCKRSKLDKGNSELDEPIVKASEIKVKIHAAGICGTDLHIIAGEYPANYSVTMVNEYSGIVVEVGEDVNDFKIEIE
ncbi:alcohol dehydrogenase catalytic domain-containing protein [Neobacillus sp. KR4-4]|uniref:alcohol dehydrogenase catalytic domain-containing protein n=1 Tax=Neobacillus sp. KR4-4 TaxID=3344872 RepID=UPI0035CC16D1